MSNIQTPILPLPRIISGGQTGADQAGLYAAREIGFETGGYAAKGFLTENGPNPLLSSFCLKDSGLTYPGRTKLNAEEAEITIWFGRAGTPGFWSTRRSAAAAKKRFIEDYAFDDKTLAEIVAIYNVVNIAGNRESSNPGIFDYTKNRLLRIFAMVKEKKTCKSKE